MSGTGGAHLYRNNTSNERAPHSVTLEVLRCKSYVNGRWGRISIQSHRYAGCSAAVRFVVCSKRCISSINALRAHVGFRDTTAHRERRSRVLPGQDFVSVAVVERELARPRGGIR